MDVKPLTEGLLLLALFVICLLPVVRAAVVRTPAALAGVAVAGVVVVLVASALRATPDAVLAAALPAATHHDGMEASGACKSCHPRQYQTWHASFHRTMTQAVSPDTVVAPFDGRRLEWRDRAFVVDRKDDEFWVTEVAVGAATKSTNAPLAAPQRVVMSTGSHHQQLYWTPAENGSLVQFPWVWEIALERWIPSEHTFVRPPDWQQHQPTWNENCIRCHSVGASPNFDAQQNQWRTEVTELGIACAGCHGPSVEHMRAHRNPLRRYAQRLLDLPDPSIVNPRRLAQERSAAICGQCHAFALLPGGFYDGAWSEFRAGDNLEPHFELANASMRGAENMFWPDGSARTGGREYNAMTMSGCYQRGELTCISCHALHGSEAKDLIEPAMNGDESCLQCHDNFRQNIASHTFHAPDSSGSRCLNCHMPNTTYGLLSTARSHFIDAPAVTGRTTRERPNACNLCHLDKTLAWTAQQLQQRYGSPADPVEADPVEGDHGEVAASVLWLLRGDAAQRATVAWHMGQPWARAASGGSWVEPHLARLLVDPYSAVRLIAHRSLSATSDNVPEYDFLGSGIERTTAMVTFLRSWEQRSIQQPAGVPPSTLIDASGRLDHSAINTLYRQRDDRRLLISE